MIQNSVNTPIETNLYKEVGDFNVKNNFKRNPIQENMGKDEFLKLLVTQLSKQDPLKPMENKEFIAQMAQFSALEQMTQVKQNIKNLSALQYLGKKVEYQLENGISYTGIAKTAHYNNGELKITVGDDTIDVNKITSVFSMHQMGQAAAAYDSSAKEIK